jgi:hypothetical protein
MESEKALPNLPTVPVMATLIMIGDGDDVKAQITEIVC